MGKFTVFLFFCLNFHYAFVLLTSPSAFQSQITLPNFSAIVFWSVNFISNVPLLFYVTLFCALLLEALLIAWKLTVIVQREFLLRYSYCFLSFYLYLIEWMSFILISLSISKLLKPFRRRFPELIFFTFSNILCTKRRH